MFHSSEYQFNTFYNIDFVNNSFYNNCSFVNLLYLNSFALWVYILFIYVFQTNDKGRLSPLTCHKIQYSQTYWNHSMIIKHKSEKSAINESYLLTILLLLFFLKNNLSLEQLLMRVYGLVCTDVS